MFLSELILISISAGTQFFHKFIYCNCRLNYNNLYVGYFERNILLFYDNDGNDFSFSLKYVNSIRKIGVHLIVYWLKFDQGIRMYVAKNHGKLKFIDDTVHYKVAPGNQ